MASWLPWVRRRQDRLRHTPLTETQRAIIAANVPMAARLEAARTERLEGLVQLFVNEKTFEGLGGLEMTEEIRVTVAAQACVILVGLDEVDVPYPDLMVIRVYPGAFRRAEGVATPWSTDRPVQGVVHGESSRHGYVVLAWDSALRGARHPTSGDNVVVHEFAHQLDTADGAADGAPILPESGLYGPWARILGRAFAQLREHLDEGVPDVLRAYGATNPAEFFAVATEVFFEKPGRLKREHPELYRMMTLYFRQDPAGD
ncbi:MAG: zinc-dependent peptidase [Myxococcales bacterium]|nr:zinc-dependent peptidase [Myxococcales bacterium]